MNPFKWLAKLILRKEIRKLEKERDLLQRWVYHHQTTIKLINDKKIKREDWDKLVNDSNSIAGMRKVLEKKGTIV